MQNAVSKYNPSALSDVLGTMQNGALQQIIEQQIAAAAAASCDYGSEAEIVLALKIKRLPNTGNMVEVKHHLKGKPPTSLGDKTENIRGNTVLYVATGGNLSATPHKQRDFVEEATIIDHQ